MATVASLNVLLQADTGKFSQGMRKAQGDLKSFSAVIRQSSDNVSRLKQLLLGGGAAAGAGFAVRQAADAEKAAVSFKVLLGSAEDAKTVLGDLASFAASTPFELAELRDATRKLVAFGVANNDLLPTLRRVGDIAAGLDIPIGELAEIYGKARVQGRLFAEDVNQLTGRGIPVIQEFAKQFGVSEQQVRKLVESGKVGFKNLEQAFVSLTSEGGKFAGLMDELSGTAAGQWSSLKDEITATARDLGTLLLPTLKEATRELGAFTRGLNALLSGNTRPAAFNPGLNRLFNEQMRAERGEELAPGAAGLRKKLALNLAEQQAQQRLVDAANKRIQERGILGRTFFPGADKLDLDEMAIAVQNKKVLDQEAANLRMNIARLTRMDKAATGKGDGVDIVNRVGAGLGKLTPIFMSMRKEMQGAAVDAARFFGELQRAGEIVSSTQTPLERFRTGLAELDGMKLPKNIKTRRTGDLLREMMDALPEFQSPAALERGSAAAFSAANKNSRNADPVNRIAQLLQQLQNMEKRTQQIQEDQLRELERLGHVTADPAN